MKLRSIVWPAFYIYIYLGAVENSGYAACRKIPSFSGFRPRRVLLPKLPQIWSGVVQPYSATLFTTGFLFHYY